jgi:hypothetical protein
MIAEPCGWRGGCRLIQHRVPHSTQGARVNDGHCSNLHATRIDV